MDPTQKLKTKMSGYLEKKTKKRAETAKEQKTWMQTIMLALNQVQKHPLRERLSHFRYSLDDIIPEREVSDLNLKNCSRLSLNHELIQRFNQLDTNLYSEPVQTNNSNQPNFNQDTNLYSEPVKLRTNNCKQTETHVKNGANCKKQIEPVYEPIELERNDYAVPFSSRISTEQRVKSLLIDNENYSVPTSRKKLSLGNEMETLRESTCFLIENSYYGVMPMYDEPERSIKNENMVVKTTNTYTEPEHTSKQKETECEMYCGENFYESVDELKESRFEVGNKEKDEVKVKKSMSFLSRLWRKKQKEEIVRSKEEIVQPKEEVVQPKEEQSKIEPKEVNHNQEQTVQSMLTELRSVIDSKLPKPLVDSIDNSKMKNTKASLLENNQGSPIKAITLSPPPVPQKSPTEKMRSIDEILIDLDSHKTEMVELRHNSLHFQLAPPKSDDLDVLLQELAKITTAPVLPPGGTQSLIIPILPDSEVARMVTKRQRRLSQPNYDVPRLVRLETSLQKKEKRNSLCLSFTPDSLEVDSARSYISHKYYNCNNRNANILENNCETFYSVPKSYVSVATHIVNTCQNINNNNLDENHTIIYKSVKNVRQTEEIFPDSLELNENATKF